MLEFRSHTWSSRSCIYGAPNTLVESCTPEESAAPLYLVWIHSDPPRKCGRPDALCSLDQSPLAVHPENQLPITISLFHISLNVDNEVTLALSHPGSNVPIARDVSVLVVAAAVVPFPGWPGACGNHGPFHESSPGVAFGASLTWTARQFRKQVVIPMRMWLRELWRKRSK